MITSLRHAIRRVFMLCLVGMGCVVGAGTELVSTSAGQPGSAASASDLRNAYAPVASPSLDTGSAFFVSLAAFAAAADTNGLVDVYRSGAASSAAAVSLGGGLDGTAVGNARSVLVSAAGTTVAVLRDPSAMASYPQVDILDLSGTQATRLPIEHDVTETALSANGACLVFVSPTDGLFPLDLNGRPDLFYYLVADGTPLYIATEDTPSSPSISSAGTRIAFVADGKLYRHEVQAATRSVPTRVEAAGSSVTSAAISGDGQWIAFASAENSLVAGDVDGLGDVFRVSLDNGAVERLSRMPLGNAFPGGVDLRDCPAVSSDGRFVAFGAAATAGGATQTWVRDATLGRTACVSVSDANSIADADCRAPAMAPGGRYVTFCSASTNLGDANGVRQVYRTDLGTGWGQNGPVAPTTALLEDLSDVIAWQWIDGYESPSDYEISLDGGITWFVPTANPCSIGDVAAADGEILIRLRATDSAGSSDYLVLPTGATQNGGGVDWTVAIVSPALRATAVIGMAETATAVGGSLPDETTGGICLLDAADNPLASDLRASAGEADWLLRVRAPANAAARWVWTIPDTFPAGRQLSVWELDALGEPVGGTAFVLAEETELSVAAGEERRFAIRFAANRTIDVALARGWNLLALPIAPESSLLTDAFVVDGETVVASHGRVWDATAQNYAETDEIPALTPCWVYARRAARALVRGTAESLATLEIAEGLNLVTVSQPVSVASLAAEVDLSGSVLQWNPQSLRYGSVVALFPGGAYWLRSSEAVSVPVSLLAAP